MSISRGSRDTNPSLPNEGPTHIGVVGVSSERQDGTCLGLKRGHGAEGGPCVLLARLTVAEVLHERAPLYLNLDGATEARGGSDGHDDGGNVDVAMW